MEELSSKFPGEYILYRQRQVFLPGDIYLAAKLEFNNELRLKTEEAMWSLGVFSKATDDMPDASVFVSAYKHKEATATSSIEGTRASVEDLYAAQDSPRSSEEHDLEEINAYLKALEKAQDLLQEMPLCNQLLRKAHAVLLDQPRGREKSPGLFRTGDVHIGFGDVAAASFIPPPFSRVPLAMDNFEKFMQDRGPRISTLIKAALLHYQFETIHPFRDGNGRLGRMLITLFLQTHGLIKQPALSISTYFSLYREAYFRHLSLAHDTTEGLMNWIEFFLGAVIETTDQGVVTATKIAKLKADCTRKITSSKGRLIEQDLRFLDRLFLTPVASISSVEKEFRVADHVAARMINRLVGLGILSKSSSRAKKSLYTFKKYMDLLENKR